MSAPITWRNVGGDTGSPAQISQIFDAATRNLSGGLNSLGGVLKDSQVVQDRNVTAIDEAARQAYLDQLAAAKTPEELAALQASGALDNARAGLSVASKAAVRGADEARTTALRTNVTAANTFDDAQVDRTDEVVKQQAAALTAKGDTAGAKALLDAHVLRKGAADLYSGIHTKDRSVITETRGDRNDQQTQDDRTFNLPFQRNATVRGDTTGQMNLTELQRSTAEAARQRTLDDKLAEFSSNHQSTTQGMRDSIDSGLMDFAGSKELPRNSDGSLAPDRMTTPQRTAVNAHLTKQGLPTVDAMVGNDTAAKERLKQSLIAAGAKPADIVARDAVMTAGVTTSPGAPIGVEAERAQLQLRTNQAEEQAINSQFGTVTAQGDKASLLKAGEEAVAGTSSGAFPGGQGRFRVGLSKWLDKGGIPVGNTGERVLPSAQQLSLVLSQIPNSWFYAGESAVSDALDTWSKSAEAQEGAMKVIKIRDRNRLLGINPLGKN